MRRIWAIVKKEFKRFFTDKRLLIATFFPGIVIFALYTIMGTFMPKFTENTIPPNTTFQVAEQNMPNTFKTALRTYCNSNSYEVVFSNIPYKEGDKVENEKAIDSAKAKIKTKEYDLLMRFDHDFETSIIALKNGSQIKKPTYDAYYNSETSVSSGIYNISVSVLYSLPDYNVTYFGTTTTQPDMADGGTIGRKVISSILPLIVISLLFSTCVSICPESIAGEKEKNTIGTLLVTPLRRSELAIGKTLALTGICSFGAISSFLGVIFSLPTLITSMNPGIAFKLDVYQYFIMFFIILVEVAFIVSLMIFISTFAKNTKEANSFISPLLVIFMVLSLSTIFLKDTQSIGYAFLPILNICSVLEQIINNIYNPLFVIATILSTLVYTVIFVLLIIRMFKSERIMFNK
ncbi:MAG: ABC transporter permease subunit [Bacilli bacterium]